MEHYVGLLYIPTYIPSDILSIDPSHLLGTYPYTNNRSVYSLVTMSSPTTGSSQDPINNNSSLPSSVLIVEYDTTDTSMTQQIIIK